MRRAAPSVDRYARDDALVTPDFDRAERHARELDGEDDSTRRAAEEPVEAAPDRPRGDIVETAVKEHKVAGTVGAVTGAVTGTVLGGPPGGVIGAATGAVRGVIAGEAFDRVKERLEDDDPASPG
jgi:hypothetical protein